MAWPNTLSEGEIATIVGELGSPSIPTHFLVLTRSILCLILTKRPGRFPQLYHVFFGAELQHNLGSLGGDDCCNLCDPLTFISGGQTLRSAWLQEVAIPI